MSNPAQEALFGDAKQEPYSLPEDVPVSSIFIDESGSKNSKGGFFVLGFLKARSSGLLYRDVRQLRQKHRFFDEIKFGGVNRDNLRFYLELAELIADADVRVGGSVYDSTTSFAGSSSTWETQARMSARLIAANVNRGELAIAFLDLVQTPKGKSLAVQVRDEANRRLGQRCVLGCYDLDSRATDLLQVADVIAGSIAYERRQWAGDTPDGPRVEETPKAKASARLRRALGLDSFNDVRHGKVNILTMRSS